MAVAVEDDLLRQVQQRLGRGAADIPSYADLTISEEEMEHAQITPTCIVEHHTYADVAVVAAPGSTGKTTIQLYELVCIALGRPLWGCRVRKPGWSLIITAEDQRERLVARLREIVRGMELTPDEIQTVRQSLCIWDVSGQQRKLAHIVDGNLLVTKLAESIVRTYRDEPPVIITWDPLVSFGADEERVNSNEQALIDAGRIMVNGLDCCVRYIHHTGKGPARSGTLDQYASRGGSALSDGARQVTVLATWRPDSPVAERANKPATITATSDASIIVMARPKLSYAPANLPNIWIKRTYYAFEYAIERAKPRTELLDEQKAQLLRYLDTNIRRGVYHTARSLESSDIELTRSQIRDAVQVLEAEGRVAQEWLPVGERYGRRSHYLKPV